MKRRNFCCSIGVFMLGSLGKGGVSVPDFTLRKKRIGIIGLDTTHALAFTKALYTDRSGVYKNYKVVAAYPFGSPEIANNGERILKFTEEIKQYDVRIVDSIDALLATVDYVLLETNDGNMHLSQAEKVIRHRKPLFIDKPIANSYEDAQAIFKLAAEYKVSVFSSSALRYVEGIASVKNEQVAGTDVYSPAPIQPDHKDLYWYGIHGVELLFAIMGKDCISVQTIKGENCDIVIGTWAGDRIGQLRAFTAGDFGFGGTVFTKGNGNVVLGEFKGYEPLLHHIIDFFETGSSPVEAGETLAICRFIDAADESKRNNGEKIFLKLGN